MGERARSKLTTSVSLPPQQALPRAIPLRLSVVVKGSLLRMTKSKQASKRPGGTQCVRGCERHRNRSRLRFAACLRETRYCGCGCGCGCLPPVYLPACENGLGLTVSDVRDVCVVRLQRQRRSSARHARVSKACATKHKRRRYLRGRRGRWAGTHTGRRRTRP